MQDLTPVSIATLLPNINSTATVYDKRDDKEYTIAKLADGNYWMTSNFNLAGGTKLYSDTSDVPAGYISTPYYTLPESATFTDGNNIPSDQFSNDSTAYVFNTGNETASQANCSSSQSCNSYYSYLAATAGSGASVSNDGYNAGYSICPAGWRLPTSTTSNAPATTNPNWKTGDFYKLATAYGASLSNQNYESAATFYNNLGPNTTPNYLLSGYYDSGAFYGGGSYSPYQSSTASDTGIYYLLFTSSYMYSAASGARKSGLAVRCIFGNNTMQTATSSSLSATIPNSGDVTNLIDSRNGASYSIKNINGTYWMTTNLALGSSSQMTLTSADTNLAPGATYNLPASSTSGFSDNAAENIYNAGFQTCSSSQPCYGYYTYAAATAGTNPSSGNAEYDICPKGWRLPTQSEYATLANNYNNRLLASFQLVRRLLR